MIDIASEFERAEHRLRAALADPAGAQETLLLQILATNRDCELGRHHDFGSIRSLADYRARVPPSGYETFRPYVDRMVAGEADVLFEGHATFFGCTSGTTAAPKRVGFNPRVRSEYVHLLGPMVSALERDHPGASRCALLLTAQFEESFTPTGVPMGNASGFGRRSLDEHPYFRFVPEVVYESHDTDARIYTMLLFALTRPMRCFASLFPVLLVNLFARAEELALALADDLEHGRLVAGPPGIRAFAARCAPRLRPLPDAARRIRDIVRVHGRFVPAEYWPDVAALHVWKGGTAKHAVPELQALFPRAEIRPMSSGSTEAALMVPLERSWIGGVPALLSTVIEYLPADAEPLASNVITLRDLERERGYRLVVTNQRGMYRYVMEDVFVVEGIYEHGVPFLRLEHRIGIVSSLTGEKVTEEHVSHAIDRAIRATGVELAAFQVAPERLAAGGASFRYVVVAELARAAAPADLRRFAAEVEADLREHNSQYVLNRNLGALAPVVLYRVRPGYFDALLRARAASGRDVQFKRTALGTALLTAAAADILEILDPEDA
jgi:GH3 auxin-responsive promoter